MLSSSIISPKYQWASGALEIRKHVELAEPVDETFYNWSQSCPLDRYVVTLHRAQWALALWIMTPLIKSVTQLRQPVRKAKFCYWTCHHTFHFSQIKLCIFPACFHSTFFFIFLSRFIHWCIATMPTNINIPDASRQMYGQSFASSHLDTSGKLQWNRTWSALQDSRSGFQLQQAESLQQTRSATG